MTIDSRVQSDAISQEVLDVALDIEVAYEQHRYNEEMFRLNGDDHDPADAIRRKFHATNASRLRYALMQLVGKEAADETCEFRANRAIEWAANA